MGGVLTLTCRRHEPKHVGKAADGTRATTGPREGEIDAEDEWTVQASLTVLRDKLITIGDLLGTASLPRDIGRIAGCLPMPVGY